jgi:arylamine N-acetyltransferase
MVTRKEIKGIVTGKEIVARRKQSDFKKVQRIIVRKQNRYNPNRTGKEIHGYRKGNYRFQRKPSSHSGISHILKETPSLRINKIGI